MKKILAILFFIPFIGYSQNINETLDYINERLEKYDWLTNFKINANIDNAKNEKGFVRLSVSEKGKLSLTYYRQFLGEYKIGFIDEVYLKELDNTVVIEHTENKKTNSHLCVIKIYCKKGACVFSSYDNNYKEYCHVSVSNKEIGNNLKNAIEHLIKLGYNNENFYDKDPFHD